jgi:Protein of unknown function (DUF1194)
LIFPKAATETGFPKRCWPMEGCCAKLNLDMVLSRRPCLARPAKGCAAEKLAGRAIPAPKVPKGGVMVRPGTCCAVALCLVTAPNLAGAVCADLSLVLAIDSSGSIDAGEFALQSIGYAAAFQSPAVKQSLASAGLVDVAVVYWADSDFAFQTFPWFRIATAEDAEAFAAIFLSTPRLLTGDTNIGNGLDRAIDMLQEPGQCGLRLIVNVSGDGRESNSRKRSTHIPLAFARDRAALLGIVVNGLAIQNEDSGLAKYYEDKLITGPGAFVLAVDNFNAFGEAIRLKLQREIGLSLSSSLDVDAFN